MPRRSHGYRPYQNATSLYGWGYNGSAGPGFNSDSFTGRPDSVGFEPYGKSSRESFWDYCFTYNDTYMGKNSEDQNRQGDVIFGGLGIGIDFPLYLGAEAAASSGNSDTIASVVIINPATEPAA